MPDSAAPISSATAVHYVWGDRCDGWHLVQAPGIAHQVLNRSGGVVEFLVISQPPAQADRELAPIA